jgi:multidrug transporter EmrE-like cation transporter
VTANLALAAVVLLTALGQVALKRGAGRLAIGAGLPALLRSVSPPLLLGMLAAVAAPPFYFVALARMELGIAFATTALTQGVVAVASRFLLRERPHTAQGAGIALVIAGLLVWNL